MSWTILVLVGLVLGSFVNVLVYRLPRSMSLWAPGSSCPHCGTRISVWDNVPLVSYILLWGRCRHCHERIALRYPLVEIAAALLVVGCALLHPAPPQMISCIVFALLLLVAAVIDLEHGYIPNLLTFSLVALGVLYRGWLLEDPSDSLLGILIAGGGLLLIAFAYRLVRNREGLGMGDVKLLAGIGAFLGWQGALHGLAAGSLLGLLTVAVAARFRPIRRDTVVPFGPFLAAGGILIALFGLVRL